MQILQFYFYNITSQFTLFLSPILSASIFTVSEATGIAGFIIIPVHSIRGIPFYSLEKHFSQKLGRNNFALGQQKA